VSTVVSMLIAGAVLLALPEDYLREGDRSQRHWAARIARTVLGVVLVAIGIVLYIWLRMRNPGALERMGQIYGGDGPSD